jgi:hypothetical protein
VTNHGSWEELGRLFVENLLRDCFKEKLKKGFGLCEDTLQISFEMWLQMFINLGLCGILPAGGNVISPR